MQIIKYPSNIIQKQLKVPDISSIKKPKWMVYTYKYKLDKDNFLLYNTLNHCLIKLSKDEYKNGLDSEILRKYLFVVDNDYPYYDIYEYLYINFKPSKELDLSKSLFSYVILSTTKCNARCKYCYENKIKRVDIEDNTVDNIINIIKTNYFNNKRNVEIKLFGGEPFFNQKPLDKIFTKLKEYNIPYKTNFISNGYLINDSLIDKMINLYCIHSGQITIDGTEENYNRIKNYKNIEINISSFKRVLENIDKLTNKQIYINIRINFDIENLNDVKILLKQLVKKYKDNKYVFIYTHNLFKKYSNDELKIILKAYKEHNKIINRNNRKYIKDYFINTQCMADSPENILIDPNGDIYKCEHMPEGGVIGNINNSTIDIDKFKSFYLKEDIYDECKKCKFKPYCINLHVCDDLYDSKCNIIKKYLLAKDLNNQILAEYNKYIKNKEEH